MPLDVWGCTRVTLMCTQQVLKPNPKGCRQSPKSHRAGDCALKLLHMNEEFLVGACHQRAPITSLPFVHTAAIVTGKQIGRAHV